MNANAFRHLYGYHFAENRKIRDHVMSLSYERFKQPVDYSHGSVRDQIIHLMDAEDVWFSELRGANPSDPIPPADWSAPKSRRAPASSSPAAAASSGACSG